MSFGPTDMACATPVELTGDGSALSAPAPGPCHEM